MESSKDLLTLLPPIGKRKKHPSQRNHHLLGGPSGTGSSPGGNPSSGDTEGNAAVESSDSDSSSSQEEEDADDENDDNDDKPAVTSPAPMNRKRKYTLTEEDGSNVSAYRMPSADEAAQTKGVADISVKVAGHLSKNRTYSIGSSTNTVNSEFDAALTETDDEPDYPRKRTIRRMSDVADLYTDIPTATASPDGLDSETIIPDEFNGVDDDEGDSTSIDFEVLTAASDDDDIDLMEAEALARDFEINGPDSPQATATPDNEIDLSFYDELLSDQDCFGEPRLLSADDPDAWTFPSGLLYHDGLISDDLFSLPVSREDSQIGSPTPRAARVMSPRADPEVLHSDGWSDDDQLVEEDLQNPFFDREDPAVQHLVNSQWVASTWMDDSEEEDDAWKYCLSSDDSSTGEDDDDESTQGVDNGDGDGSEEEAEDSDSDATDDDEDLPLPTPLKLSKLKRLSSPTPESAQPQILQRDPNNRNGPFLGSWVADPTRPICIIDGAKKTMLVPSNHKRFSIDSDSSCHNIYSMLEESEYDTGVVFAQGTPVFTYGVSNPTMSGFSVNGGGYLNGAELCGPPEAFNPCKDFSDFDELLREEYDRNDDSVDEEEQKLSFEDILALSESEDEGDGKTQGNNLAATQESDAEVNRWQYIPVTSFRKRQQQHKQRLSGQLPWIKGRAVMKPKLTSTDATIAPARRRKAPVVKTPHIKPTSLPKRRV